MTMRFSRRSLAACVAAILPLASQPTHAESYVFDHNRTEVRFTYLMGPGKQQGRFSKVDGTLQFDPAAPERSQVSGTVQTASLETGEPIVDGELKSSDFFNVAADPVMTFKSQGVRTIGAEAAEMTGDITVNGITKPITLEVSLRPHDNPALKYSAGAKEFVARTRIQRSAFNMTAYQSLVGDDVDIEIDAIVRKQ
jgi:polyisoprenoid-binding protein YceI